MSNSSEMQAFIVSAERYLLSLGKEELNKRIDSRIDGDIGKLILEAGFLEKENLADEKSIHQYTVQIKYVKDINIREILDRETKSPNYNAIDWSLANFKRISVPQPLHFQEMFSIPTIYSFLFHQGDLNDYFFEEPEACPKIA